MSADWEGRHAQGAHSLPGQAAGSAPSMARPDRRGERKFVDLVIGDLEPGGTFSGYASLFGRVDLGRDLIEQGAFARSLRTRGAAGIRMLFQHDPNQPIGRWIELK